MKSIMIQASQSVHQQQVIDDLKEHAKYVIAEENELGELILKKGRDITAIVIFEVTDRILKLCELTRNERFCNPLLPIAYVGHPTIFTTLPYGVKRFDASNLFGLKEYLSTSLNVKALVVEDDEAIRDIVSLTLSKNLIVSTADDGNTAIKMIDSNKYDVVILDVMLPGKNGEAVFTHVRKTAPQTAVVIITAYDTTDREFSYTYEGAAAYIKKPFISNKEFRHSVIKALLGHHDYCARAQLGDVFENRNAAQRKNIKRMSRYTL